MTPIDHLAELRRELDAFAELLHGDLTAPVPSCGAWTLRDLADHLGRGNHWVVVAVTERRSDGDCASAKDEAAVEQWFRGTAERLLSTLQADPDTEAWTFWPPHTVGFWRRRRMLETVVHRWDAEHALGRPGEIDPRVADDGVAEVLEVMVPRQIRRGRAEPRTRAVQLTATDTGTSWRLGPGEPVAGLSGSAADLLLVLWRRLSATDPAITWTGDQEAGLRVLAGPLVP